MENIQEQEVLITRNQRETGQVAQSSVRAPTALEVADAKTAKLRSLVSAKPRTPSVLDIRYWKNCSRVQDVELSGRISHQRRCDSQSW